MSNLAALGYSEANLYATGATLVSHREYITLVDSVSLRLNSQTEYTCGQVASSGGLHTGKMPSAADRRVQGRQGLAQTRILAILTPPSGREGGQNPGPANLRTVNC